MSTSDKRKEGPQFPVARIDLGSVDWVTSEGHAVQNLTAANINGTIERVDVLISSVTANPTVTITVTDENSVTIDELSSALNALADGTNHHFVARSNLGTPDADFNPVTVNNTLTFAVDPSADPGGAGQTLTVQIILYMR